MSKPTYSPELTKGKLELSKRCPNAELKDFVWKNFCECQSAYLRCKQRSKEKGYDRIDANYNMCGRWLGQCMVRMGDLIQAQSEKTLKPTEKKE